MPEFEHGGSRCNGGGIFYLLQDWRSGLDSTPVGTSDMKASFGGRFRSTTMLHGSFGAWQAVP